MEVREIAVPEALPPATCISGAHRLMEIVGWRQRASAGLHGMSLVRKKVGPVPSDIYQHY